MIRKLAGTRWGNLGSCRGVRKGALPRWGWELRRASGISFSRHFCARPPAGTYFFGTCLVVGFLLFAGRGAAAEWGNLTATFVYDGDPPPVAKANITSDKEFCCKFDVRDESLVVDPENKGVANVVAVLSLDPTQDLPPIHPDYAANEKGEVFLDNKQCRFEPHVALLRTSQTLVLTNSDSIAHNMNFTPFDNPPFNVLVPTGGQSRHRLAVEEQRVPATMACNIHPWMGARVVVKRHPYMAVSNPDGCLEIKNLPVGEWTFQFWHEKAGYLSKVSVLASPTDRRGKCTIPIRVGSNDLGPIKLPPSLFD